MRNQKRENKPALSPGTTHHDQLTATKRIFPAPDISKEIRQLSAEIKDAAAKMSAINLQDYLVPKRVLENFTCAELQLSYTRPSQTVLVDDSYTAWAVFKHVWDKQMLNIAEQFYVLYLNKALHLLGWRCLGTGGINAVLVDPRIILSIAVQMLATSIIVAHNHPSGAIKPSLKDKLFIESLKEACKQLDIALNDSLIITEGDAFFSFADKKIL